MNANLRSAETDTHDDRSTDTPTLVTKPTFLEILQIALYYATRPVHGLIRFIRRHIRLAILGSMFIIVMYTGSFLVLVLMMLTGVGMVWFEAVFPRRRRAPANQS